MPRLLSNVLIVNDANVFEEDPHASCPICGNTPDYHDEPGIYSCKPCQLLIVIRRDSIIKEGKRR